MSLDVSAYSTISLLKKFIDNDNIGHENEYDIDSNTIELRNNRYYPIQSGNIVHGIYSYESDISFNAGTYHGYNRWRSKLANLVGYCDDAIWSMCTANNEMPAIPFVELINFSDCEGVFCAKISNKLFNDFKTFDEKAVALGDKYFYIVYKQFMEAFKLASINGAVEFC